MYVKKLYKSQTDGEGKEDGDTNTENDNINLEISKKKSITEKSVTQNEQSKPSSFKKQLKSTEQAKANPTNRPELNIKYKSILEKRMSHTMMKFSMFV